MLAVAWSLELGPLWMPTHRVEMINWFIAQTFDVVFLNRLIYDHFIFLSFFMLNNNINILLVLNSILWFSFCVTQIHVIEHILIYWKRKAEVAAIEFQIRVEQPIKKTHKILKYCSMWSLPKSSRWRMYRKTIKYAHIGDRGISELLEKNAIYRRVDASERYTTNPIYSQFLPEVMFSDCRCLLCWLKYVCVSVRDSPIVV